MLRAFHVTGPDALEMREMAMPSPGAGEIVLGIRAALTCGTDVKLVRRGHPVMPFPTRIGHEYAGVVLAAGDGARFREGDDVMTTPTAPCGRCGLCARGSENLCDEAMRSFTLGGFADALLMPRTIVETNAYLKPASLEWSHAALLEPLSCVVQGMERIQLRAGESVAILGAGPIGLMQLMLARAARAAPVVVIGRHAPRLDAARRLGADAVLDEQALPGDSLARSVRELTGGLGADVVIECVATPQAWEQAIPLARRGGRVLWFGGCRPGTTVSLDTYRMHYDEITATGVFHQSPRSVREAQRLLASGELDVGSLMSGTVPLEGLPGALERVAKGECLKLAITP